MNFLSCAIAVENANIIKKDAIILISDILFIVLAEAFVFVSRVSSAFSLSVIILAE